MEVSISRRNLSSPYPTSKSLPKLLHDPTPSTENLFELSDTNQMPSNCKLSKVNGTKILCISNCSSSLLFLILCIEIALQLTINHVTGDHEPFHKPAPNYLISGDQDFTFLHNGSFLQIDAGREWPINSKREISFRFKTRSPHGLLLYQTFDHQKLPREDEQDDFDILSTITNNHEPQIVTKQALTSPMNLHDDNDLPEARSRRQIAPGEDMKRANVISNVALDVNQLDLTTINRLASNSITATASAKLANSLFSASPTAAINGNAHSSSTSGLEAVSTDVQMSSAAASRARSRGHAGLVQESSFNRPNYRFHDGGDILMGGGNGGGSGGGTTHGDMSGPNSAGLVDASAVEGSTILSSSAVSTISASLNELYLKLENGRLKLMYEFGLRLNQTFCGKGLNDNKWHRVELKVDPELNQIILILDQTLTLEVAPRQHQTQHQLHHHQRQHQHLSQKQPQLQEQQSKLQQISVGQDDDSVSQRRNELVFTNSILYLGGLNNNSSIIKNVKQRSYLAQFIGCIGQIMIKSDQGASESPSQQPVQIDKLVLVKRNCLDLCETNNYCLHKSTCVNHYTTTKCDCFGTNYEDVYCWQPKLTTLTMLGYSTLVYRIYDWRDRYQSFANRMSLQFRTLAKSSILFFAHGGDLVAQQQANRNQIPLTQSYNPNPTATLPATNPVGPIILSNISSSQQPTMQYQRPPVGSFYHQGNNNYLAVSLSNGSLVVEVNFGDQPILLSTLLYEKIFNQSAVHDSTMHLADGRWHNITFLHSNRQLELRLDEHSIILTKTGKFQYFYFDPSIYIGGIPNFLHNETRAMLKPFNLRHKFVGCLRSVYFNQHNILVELKKNSTMVDYRDIIGRPQLDECRVSQTSALPLTLRSGKSYLTFQISANNQIQSASKLDLLQISKLSNHLQPQSPNSGLLKNSTDSANDTVNSLPVTNVSGSVAATKLPATTSKTTRIEFEYKTHLQSHFLAGGHLRDIKYHDLGGFWTLYAHENCKLYFTMSSGLTFDPEQVIELQSEDNPTCEPNTWYRVEMCIMSGDKILNITRTRQMDSSEATLELDSGVPDDKSAREQHGRRSYTLASPIELLHQVQIGGDLAKFGESLSIPFSGCMRRIKINDHAFDSRDFVTTVVTSGPSQISTSYLPSTNSSAPTPGASPGAYNSLDFVSNRLAQGYVTIDSCQLVNPCLSHNPCKNNGVCKVSEFGEADCDCTKTGYIGRRCHFSMYKQSCQELYLSGQRKSSYYLIDLDRNGPLRPIRVRCNMEEYNNGATAHIETSISHNLPAEYLIRRSSTSDVVLDITYMAFHHMYTHDGFYIHDEDNEAARSEQQLMLRSLIGHSLYCKQSIKYECRLAPLELGNLTWFEASFPTRHRIASLDSSDIYSQQCACAASEKKCFEPNRRCNCDSNESFWTEDSAELVGHEQVGLTRIVLLKQNADDFGQSSRTSGGQERERNLVESQSRFSLSELKCYGAKQHETTQYEITFKTSDAYIEVPGWRRGDISFSFRTASIPPAIILYQVATSRNHGYFRLTLISDVRLLFEFIVNRRPRKAYLTSSHKLNNGQWQQVYIEYDAVNLRLTINDDSIMIDLDVNDHLGTFEGPLYIGGAPSKYLIGDLSKRNGFTGCFKGLVIAQKPIDLSYHLNPTVMPSVITGCRPSCTKNLCQNGGRCIEYWGSYECECSNPIAHSGNNCEINLNTNSITFVTQESYYLQTSSDLSVVIPAYLVKNILLNIRTYQETALIMYAYDKWNNFIQLHKNGSSLVLTYNSNSTIVMTQLPIDIDSSSGESTAILSPMNTNPKTVLEYTNTIQSSLTQITRTKINQTITQMSPVLLPANSSLPLNNQTAVLTSSKVSNSSSLTGLVQANSIDRMEVIRASNTSGSGQPIQIKIERHRLRTTFYVNNNVIVIEKPMIFLTNYTQNPWLNPELELVRPLRTRAMNPTKNAQSRLFLANVDQLLSTRLPGFTGCIQGLNIDNQLFDFNRAHLFGEFDGEYRIGCKMHCDLFPCKNQGTCVENWLEDKIQCKCDATSYVGRLCDEDIAATFNGRSSRFVYNLDRRLMQQLPTAVPSLVEKRQQQQQTSTYNLMGNAKQVVNETEPFKQLNVTKRLDINQANAANPTFESTQNARSSSSIAADSIDFLEVSLAFSTEVNQSYLHASLIDEPYHNKNLVQVLVLITRANSSRHFFLGLTNEGSLLIQEDYGNSMSLSRLIKKLDQPYNDGHRHMVKYSRFNQTIQINVDHQTYLPSLSVISSDHMAQYSKSSVIAVGTVLSSDVSEIYESPKGFESNHVNYQGCISNLLIRLNDIMIEPFSEAFGHNIDSLNKSTSPLELTIKANGMEKKFSDPKLVSRSSSPHQSFRSSALDHAHKQRAEVGRSPPEIEFTRIEPYDPNWDDVRMASMVEKTDELSEGINIISVRDVEQGKCAPFKRVESNNEKRSINEPKHTPLLEPRPIYMDPPKVKSLRWPDRQNSTSDRLHLSKWLFYCSLSLLLVVAISSASYACILQRRYKSEKFRCETPFFHKRDEANQTPSSISS